MDDYYMNREMQNDDYERRVNQELDLNDDPFATAEANDGPPSPEELWSYDPVITTESTSMPTNEPPTLAVDSPSPEMQPPAEHPIAPPTILPPQEPGFVVRDGVTSQVPRCPRCGHDMAKRFCGQCGFDSNIIQRPPQDQHPPQLTPPPYQNNPYQGNTYQNGQYQGNPYPVGQYQRNPYPGNQYQGNPYQGSPQQGYQNPQNSTTFTNTIAGQTWYPPYPAPKKKHTGIIVLVIVLAVFFGLLFVGAIAVSSLSYSKSYTSSDKIGIDNPFEMPNFGGSNKPSGSEILPNGVNLEEYKKLMDGMSYGQVSAIIGGDGQMTDSGENVKGQKYYTYSWICEDTANDAIVHITFVDGAVTDILLAGELY